MAEADDPSGVLGTSRRLATIVAIDAAGYSRQSEIDEATAIKEITALGERVRASAGSRGGRVFNTAGDGFMLEFSAVSSALAAAEEVQSVARVPLRIGIHVGEVQQTPTGDLLGKGVNVAARLMNLAAPGAIVVSGDVRRALPGGEASRLTRRGAVRLQKMNELLETFELPAPWRRPGIRLPRWAPAAGRVAAIAAALLALFIAFRPPDPESGHIAVLEFRALEPALQTFSAALGDRIVGTMSVNDLQVAHNRAANVEASFEQALQAGASFVLEGSVRTDGDDLLVSARLVDTRSSLAIWSSEYRRAAAEESYLQEQIAANTAHVLRCALVTMRPRAGHIDSATLSLFLRACDRKDAMLTNPEEVHEIARQVTVRAPRFARGWSMRAMTAAELASRSAVDAAAQYEAEARDAAARARRLDPRNGESFLAEAVLLPVRDWRGRQELIDRAFAAEPDLAAAHAAQAALYMSLGLNRDALASLRRANALEPLTAEYWALMTPNLGANGEGAEAAQLRERLYRVWPNSPDAWFNRFFNSSYNSDPAEALRMLETLGSAPVVLERAVVMRWRAYLQARQSGDQARMRRAALDLLELVRARQFSSAAVAAALSNVGEVDAAYEIMEAYLRFRNVEPASLFLPPFEAMRRDRRFMAMLRDTGLLQYWRETGRWPDFCASRGLPYECAAEAARALGA